ncbi:MAG: PfkB family carbohydrate kinase [bacterium]|nr:PfkB family carbohydrate kinase [bacterium]
MQTAQKKILNAEQARAKLAEMALQPGNTGLTFGHFNVVHPGHLRFLHHARENCDRLVVAIMSQEQLEEGQKGRFFSAGERALGVAALQAVDQVVVLEGITLVEVIDALKPNSFVLGKEFEEERREETEAYLEAVERNGGKISYSSGDVSYSSSDMLFQQPEDIHHEKIREFKEVCRRAGIDLSRLGELIDRFTDQRLLVLGDTIVDQYIACDALGMSQEAPVLVVRELDAKEFVGGAGIVACHVQTLGANCHYLSVIGQDEKGRLIQRFMDDFKVGCTLLEDSSRPTTFKIRYMVENQKLLRVSRLLEHSISKKLEKQVLEKIASMAPELDGIVVSDFVYGVITDSLLEGLGKIAQEHGIKLFGDLQCSSQVGNVAKFQNYHLITPTEREARIALSDQESGLEKLARRMLAATHSSNLLITLGAAGFIAYQGLSGEPGKYASQHFPALNQTALDVAGAGDTLLATMAISQCAGANLLESAALGACTAAIAVGRVGNIPITAVELKAYLGNLLKQMQAEP